jgi:hypothetical protein
LTAENELISVSNMEWKQIKYFDKTLRFRRNERGFFEFNTEDFCKIIGKSPSDVFPSGVQETISLNWAYASAADNSSVQAFLNARFGNAGPTEDHSDLGYFRS